MTICIVSFRPDRILFASDQFGYICDQKQLKLAIELKLSLDHTNFAKVCTKIPYSKPKIYKLGKNTAFMCSGSGKIENLLTKNLNPKQDNMTQLLEKLSSKKEEGFANCYLGKFDEEKNQCLLYYVCYKNGMFLRKERHTGGNVLMISAFAPEIKSLFRKKYEQNILYAPLELQLKFIKAFFDEVTDLYQGATGGIPFIVIIDGQGIREFTSANIDTSPAQTTLASTTGGATLINVNYDTWTTLCSVTAPSSDHDIAFVLATMLVSIASGGIAGYVELRLYNSSDEEYYPSSSGVRVAIELDPATTYYHYISALLTVAKNIKNDTISLQMRHPFSGYTIVARRPQISVWGHSPHVHDHTEFSPQHGMVRS